MPASMCRWVGAPVRQHLRVLSPPTEAASTYQLTFDVSHELALIESHPELADPASVEDIVETVAEEEK